MAQHDSLNPPLTIAYRDPSRDRRTTTKPMLLRVLAASLAACSAALVINAWWNGWGQHFVHRATITTTIAAVIGLMLRAWDRNLLLPLRFVWILAAVVFSLWAFIILANQFHGRPPPSDRYLLAFGAVAFSMSIVGFFIDAHRATPIDI